MLDAIASAPFLVVAPQAPEMEDADEHFNPAPHSESAEPMSTVPVFDAPPESEHVHSEPEAKPSRTEGRRPRRSDPEPEPTPSRYESQAESEQNQPKRQDHEIAASAVDVEDKPVAEDSSETAQQAEARRHPIHGAPEDPPPEPAAAPRKMGWWSRRKTG